MNKILLSLLFTSLITTLVMANDISGKVIAVIDGNTFKVEGNDAQVYTIMLAGIDCPELGQDYSERAKKCLEKLMLNKIVSVTLKGKDRFGNTTGNVLIEGSKDPRIDLLKEGLAWTSEKNPEAELETIRSAAQQKGRGLWKQDNPTPPWKYRRDQTMIEPKSI